MSDARTEILQRITAIERSIPPPPAHAYRVAGGRTGEALVELFCARVADYRAEVRRIASGDVAAQVTAVCAAHAVARLGVPEALRASWRPRADLVVEDTGHTAHELDALDGSLTASTVAVAETGTIILTAGPEEGRRALTLIPDLHICVVEAGQIVELLPEALRAVTPLVRTARRPVTLVSGPSATSDIELSRVEGVHGPRRLVVLVVDA